jgi:HD domain
VTDGAALTVTPRTGSLRRVTQSEFERSLPLLDRAGRSELLDARFNSLYIEAIVDDLGNVRQGDAKANAGAWERYGRATSDPTPGLGPRFEAALLYAAHVHGGQRRKGTSIPYVSHLLGVASLVLDDGGDEDEGIAALLHDAAEDQGGQDRLDDISIRFGERVARIVDGCSDTLETPKPAWLERKKAYVERLEHEPTDVLKVSLADKLYNARAIVRDVASTGPAAWARFNAAPLDLASYYGALADVFVRSYPGPMASQLAEVVERLKELATQA